MFMKFNYKIMDKINMYIFREKGIVYILKYYYINR